MDYINTIYKGDCINVLNSLPEKTADLIFADPPYNLQLEGELYRPNETKVNAVDDEWDKFTSDEEYDEFTRQWLMACKRVLKDTGTIWVIGSYHNIFRVGKVMSDLGFWTLNDIIWVKTNPMPNFKGTRFTNAHETLIWAKKSKEQKCYTFNYQSMKMMNDDKQMRSDWHIPICSGSERCKINDQKAHSTQKPEALLKRIMLSSTNPGDVVLDPFFGSGTTGAVAKKLKRNWIGIEREQKYIEVAADRINSIDSNYISDENLLITKSKKDLPKVNFSNLIDISMIEAGDFLYSKNKKFKAQICIDGALKTNDFKGSIHKTGAYLQNKNTCNGWDYWFIEKNNSLISIDALREQYRKTYL